MVTYPTTNIWWFARVSFFHSLNAVLWYDTPSLRHLVVLDAKWVVDAATCFIRQFNLKDHGRRLHVIIDAHDGFEDHCAVSLSAGLPFGTLEGGRHLVYVWSRLGRVPHLLAF